ncbi:hypothetical protein HMPREF0653_00601 [Prevotella disiens JCM 6334 = ATCC 29426]|uniref:Uncharacterized protein n=1 Tax=Prevotella disiens JCM 6334 = ATCC 29426 TaxID=1235811 RepID=A0ABN0NUD5_9BACT|nr:hypothetical protein HMPREF0653_00601 [Prevotella disiens JCM 6334 = ATCC 29426]
MLKTDAKLVDYFHLHKFLGGKLLKNCYHLGFLNEKSTVKVLRWVLFQSAK